MLFIVKNFNVSTLPALHIAIVELNLPVVGGLITTDSTERLTFTGLFTK